MRKAWSLLVLSLLPHASIADVTIMLGITLRYEYHLGLTLKAITNDQADQYVLAGGASYYPFSKEKTGIDLSTDDAYLSFGMFH